MGFWRRLVGSDPGGPAHVSFRAAGDPGFGLDHEFSMALSIGTPEDIDAFIRSGVRPNARLDSSSGSRPPILDAVSNSRHALGMVEVLLGHGADPNVRELTVDRRNGRSKPGQTALEHLAHHGTWQLKSGEACEVARALIGAGAAVDASDPEGRGLVQLTALNARWTDFKHLRRITDVTKLFIAYGAPTTGGDPSALSTIQAARSEHRDRKRIWYPGGPLGGRITRKGPAWEDVDEALARFEALLSV